MKRIVIAVLLVVSMAEWGHARSLYVNPNTGSDSSADGLSATAAGGPSAMLRAALSGSTMPFDVLRAAS